jgi:hypothetical protein
MLGFLLLLLGSFCLVCIMEYLFGEICEDEDDDFQEIYYCGCYEEDEDDED